MEVLKLNPKTAALSLGSLFAILHAGWVILVAGKYGTPMYGYMMSMHFTNSPMQLSAFSPITGLTGIVLVFIVGAVIGGLFAYLWNYFSK